jgi:hypothetical protein
LLNGVRPVTNRILRVSRVLPVLLVLRDVEHAELHGPRPGLSRGDHRASLPAAAGGTLLLLDAWFDVCTSAPGTEHAMALAEAAFAEIPLAIAAWWLAIGLANQTR